MYFRTSCTLASVSGSWVEGVFSIGFSSCSNRLYKMRYINSKEMALTNTASQSGSLGFHMERWYRVNSNGTEMEKVVHTHRTSCRSGWSGWFTFGELNPSPHFWIFRFRLCGFQSSLLLIHFRCGPNTCSHRNKVWHRTYPLCDAPIII